MTTPLNVDGSKVPFLDASRSLGANTDMHTVRALHTETTQTFGSLEGLAAEIVAAFYAEVAAANAIEKYGNAGIGKRAKFFKAKHAARLRHLLENASVSDLYDVVHWQDDQTHSSDDLETKIFHARSRGALERLILARVDEDDKSARERLKTAVRASDQWAEALERRRTTTPQATQPIGSRLALRSIVDEIDAFEAQCEEDDYTDTGEVWALLEGFRSMAKSVTA